MPECFRSHAFSSFAWEFNEMAARKSTLFNMLVEDLASRFLQEFYERSGVIYREAESRSYRDDGIHEALQSYHCGQTRFALHQSMFLRLASECGMKSEIYKCPENGFPTCSSPLLAPSGSSSGNRCTSKNRLPGTGCA